MNKLLVSLIVLSAVNSSFGQSGRSYEDTVTHTTIVRKRSFVLRGQVEKEHYDSLTKQIQSNPKNSELYLKRGEIVFKSNYNGENEFLKISNSDALKDIRKAIELEPNRPSGYKVLADYYWYIDENLKLAIETISKSVDLEPSNPAWLSRRGFLNKKAGLDKEACEDWILGSQLAGVDAENCKKMKASYCR